MIAIGPGFVPYAQPVFQRCIHLVHQSLVEYQTFAANPAQYDEPDKTFLIVSLDLLSGLTQGLNTSITELYQSSEPPVLTLVALCLQVSLSRTRLGWTLFTDPPSIPSAPRSSCTTIRVRSSRRHCHLLLPHPSICSRRFHARIDSAYRARTESRDG